MMCVIELSKGCSKQQPASFAKAVNSHCLYEPESVQITPWFSIISAVSQYQTKPVAINCPEMNEATHPTPRWSSSPQKFTLFTVSDKVEQSRCSVRSELLAWGSACSFCCVSATTSTFKYYPASARGHGPPADELPVSWGSNWQYTRAVIPYRLCTDKNISHSVIYYGIPFKSSLFWPPCFDYTWRLLAHFQNEAQTRAVFSHVSGSALFKKPCVTVVGEERNQR